MRGNCELSRIQIKENIKEPRHREKSKIKDTSYTYVLQIFLYASEYWILKKADADKICTFETFLLSKNAKDYTDSKEINA